MLSSGKDQFFGLMTLVELSHWVEENVGETSS